MKMKHYIIGGLFLLAALPVVGFAQESAATSSASEDAAALNASSTSASTTAANLVTQRQSVSPANDLTRPEELPEKVAIISLFEARPVNKFEPINATAYWVQEAVRMGVPANTIFLILLTPFLAFFVSFVRVVVGLPTLDMLAPIALTFALIATGISVGMLVLTTIIFASYISKRLLARTKIMFYPKRSLSLVLLPIAVFAALTIGVALGFDRILNVSIFPILVLMLLGDMIVSVQLHKSSSETLMITSTTIMLGLFGFILASSDAVQNILILYPELVLLAIPANLMIGRYFGLRLTEVFRFSSVITD